MNTDLMFSSQTDMWETPQDFFDKLDTEFHFTMDACAVKQNAKCERFISPQEDGLSKPWEGVVWCNPPYGKTIGKWVQKAYTSAQGGGNGGHAHSRKDGHEMVSRLHLSATGRRNPLHKGQTPLRQQHQLCPIPVYGRCV